MATYDNKGNAQKAHKEQAVAYIIRGGNRCPCCGFDEPWRSEITFEDGVYLQTCECPYCKLSWHDVAPLTDIVLPDENGDSVTYSIRAFRPDETEAIARAIVLLSAAGCNDSAAVLECLLRENAP